MPNWATWVLLVLVLGRRAPCSSRSRRRVHQGRRRRRGARESGQGAERGRLEPRSAAARRRAEVERERVLVVDDDPGLRLLLRATLPASEFDVEEAESAEAAAETARFFRPAVVILDVDLPGKDGLAFCQELKRSTSSPHVILLTGADLDRDALRSAGADALLRKPFSPVELLALVDKVSQRDLSGTSRRLGRGRRPADDLRARSQPRRRGRARAATAPPARLPSDRDRAGRRARGEGPDDGSARSPRPALRARARRGVRRVARRRSQPRVRVPAPRRREDRRSRRRFSASRDRSTRASAG